MYIGVSIYTLIVYIDRYWVKHQDIYVQIRKVFPIPKVDGILSRPMEGVYVSRTIGLYIRCVTLQKSNIYFRN